LEYIADPFGYYLDHVIPDKPPLLLTPEQVITASQQYPQGPNQCIQGAVSGVAEEYVWSVLLGPVGPLDMMMAAYIGCMTSSGGKGDGDNPKPPLSKKEVLKKLNLPTTGKIRFVPPDWWSPGQQLPKGPNGGYLDKFGNEWVKGRSVTPGQSWEWDVQLSSTGKSQLGWLSKDGKHVNVSWDGEVTH
jgi:hypothetical protein